MEAIRGCLRCEWVKNTHNYKRNCKHNYMQSLRRVSVEVSQRFFLSGEKATKRREREKPLVTLDLNLTFMQLPGSGSDPQAWIG